MRFGTVPRRVPNNGKGPVWCYPLEKIYSDDNRPTDDQLQKMKDALSRELDILMYI